MRHVLGADGLGDADRLTSLVEFFVMARTGHGKIGAALETWALLRRCA